MLNQNSCLLKLIAQAMTCACIGFLAPLHATELVGRVVDISDARVFSDAKIFVRKNADNALEAHSDSEGFFRLSNVPAGAYLIDVNLADGRTFMTRLMINPKRTTQFIELDYSRIMTPHDDEDY